MQSDVNESTQPAFSTPDPGLPSPGVDGRESSAAAQAVAGQQGESRAAKGSGRGSVLVVEDDPACARMVTAHLQGAGYQVSVASTAAEAQASIERAVPDLILCDVGLPDMNGIQLTSWVRAKFGRLNLPIALITASDDSRTLSRGLAAGADDFLAKPVHSLELRTRVRSLLRSKILADEIRAREEVALPFAGDFQRATESQDMVVKEARWPVALIVEDDPQERRLLEAQLAGLHCTTLGADTAAAGLELARQSAPDVILLDLLLPDRSGYDFISLIKNDPECSRVPILVVSAMSEVQDRVKALELGADDFIVKGFERLEFEARVRRLLRLKQSLDQLNHRCNEALQLAVTDSLTGLFTYGFMQETLNSQLSAAQRYGSPYSLIFADIDHFKQVNDRWGHAAGDAALRAVSQTIRQSVRQSDTPVRNGGDEFVILLPHTGLSDAVLLAERMRERVAGLSIAVDGVQSIQVTLSLGVASFPDDAIVADTLVERGDSAMYLAKQSGRNRVATCAADAAAQSGAARILLVDNDAKNLRQLEAHFAPEGYELLYAQNGHEAIEVAGKQRLDVVIMNAMMSELSGYEACRRLKQDSRTQLLPVILLTEINVRDEKLRGIEAGADEFISKPLDKVELVTRIRALIRQKRSTDLLEDAETVICALARSIEDRDPLLRNHSDRVAHYAVALGRAVALSERDLNALRRAAIVHDIGKIAIPDAILLKPGEFTAEERQIVERHPEAGFKLLQPLRTFGDSLPAVRFHHERLDGSGYPLGLSGEEVPLLAQIVAIADVYDALCSPRHHRPALSPSDANETLRDEARRGLHDPQLIEAFIAHVASGAVVTDERVPAECAN